MPFALMYSVSTVYIHNDSLQRFLMMLAMILFVFFITYMPGFIVKMVRNVVRKKRDFVGKISKWRTPSPQFGNFHIFLPFFCHFINP